MSCTAPAETACDKCNEPAYVLNAEGDACISSCPSGQFKDRSGPPGTWQCAYFNLLTACDSANCHTFESGHTAMLRVYLSRRPSSNVRVILASSNSGKGVVSPSIVVLTPLNWQDGVNVTVTGVRNYAADGAVEYFVSAAVDSTADTRYAGVTARDMSVWSYDVDGSSDHPFQCGMVGSSTLTEGSTVTAECCMTYDPLSFKAVQAVSSRASHAEITAGAAFSFTSDSWQTLRQVVVRCPRNYYAEGDVSSVITVSFVDEPTRQLQIPLVCRDVDVAGIAATPGPTGLNVNQLGTRAILSVVLTSKPLADVVVLIDVTPATEARVVGGPLTFAPATWNIVQSVQIEGIRSNGATDASLSIKIGSDAAVASSVVAQYQSATWHTLHGVNKHISFPVIKSLSRTLSPLLGGWNLTAVGTSILPGCRVTVSQAGTRSASVISFESKSGHEELSFTTPEGDTTGYAEVMFTNTDGGYGMAPKLFYTDDCPTEGQFGRGKNCIECPEGAICPGGYRMWARLGYWTPSETAGSVYKCPDPPSRCPGWTGNALESACAPQYSGTVCGQCAPRFYPYLDSCQPCGDDSVIVLLAIVDAVFILVLTVLMVVLPNWALRWLVAIAGSLQGIRAVGQMASSRQPAALNAFYYYLSLTSVDVSFLRSACTNLGNGYVVVFWGNLMLIGAFVAPLVAVLSVMAVVMWSRRQQYLNRLVRGLTVYASMFYLVLSTRAFQAIYCEKGSTKDLILAFDSTTPCFEGNELSVTVAGWVLLAFAVLAYPVAILAHLYRLQKQGRLDDPVVVQRFGYLYHSFKRNRLFFATQYYVQLMLLALAAALGPRSPKAQIGLSASAFLITFAMTLLLKPYRDPFFGACAALASFVGLCGVALNGLSNWNSTVPQESILYIALGLLLLALAVSVLVGLYLFRKGLLPDAPPALLKRFPALAKLNKHKSKVVPLEIKETPKEVENAGIESVPPTPTSTLASPVADEGTGPEFPAAPVDKPIGEDPGPSLSPGRTADADETRWGVRISDTVVPRLGRTSPQLVRAPTTLGPVSGAAAALPGAVAGASAEESDAPEAPSDKSVLNASTRSLGRGRGVRKELSHKSVGGALDQKAVGLPARLPAIPASPPIPPPVKGSPPAIPKGMRVRYKMVAVATVEPDDGALPPPPREISPSQFARGGRRGRGARGRSMRRVTDAAEN